MHGSGIKYIVWVGGHCRNYRLSNLLKGWRKNIFLFGQGAYIAKGPTFFLQQHWGQHFKKKRVECGFENAYC